VAKLQHWTRGHRYSVLLALTVVFVFAVTAVASCIPMLKCSHCFVVEFRNRIAKLDDPKSAPIETCEACGGRRKITLLRAWRLRDFGGY